MSNLIIIKDGVPQFIGKEDPTNPPVMPRSGSKVECPLCHGQFDYLVGEDTPDGGKQGCESCWKPGELKAPDGAYDTSKEIL